MKYILTTICAAFMTITAGAQTQSTTETVEVREFINQGKSTIVFAAPDNELRNDYDDLFAMIEEDYNFVKTVEINASANTVSVVCTKDVGLVEVSELMKEFRISKYHYDLEVDTAEL